MREFRTSGSVGDGVGNDPIYPANPRKSLEKTRKSLEKKGKKKKKFGGVPAISISRRPRLAGEA
jgi:hypothetical protein